MKRVKIFILMIVMTQIIIAQNPKLDSLNDLINKAGSDTDRIKLILKKVEIMNLDSAITLMLRTIAENERIMYYRGEVDLRTKLIYNYAYKGNYKSAFEHMDFLENYITTSNDSVDFGLLYENYGLLYGIQSKYDSSIYFYKKAIRIYEPNVHKKIALGRSYSNIAIGFQQQSNFPEALSFFQKALRISEEEKEGTQQAHTNLNIGIVYTLTGDLPRAESSYKKAIDLAKKLKLSMVELYAYTNLSAMYEDDKKWQESYDFAAKAAEMGHSMGDHGIEAASLSKAARALAQLDRPKEAMSFADKAIAVADSSGQPLNISQSNSSKGFVLMSSEMWKDAIPFYQKAISFLDDADTYNKDFALIFSELAECYEKTGQYSKALSAYKDYATIIDSVRRKDNIQKTTELTMNYEFEKKEQAARVEQEARDAITRARQFALMIGLLLSVIIIIGAFIGYINKRRANVLLQKQKKQIETQKDYLSFSINYARRIQSAVFPSDNILSDNFPENFILFKPLDQVSGDFYWYKQSGDGVYIAAADCTGHGVPGALMSILGITFLNEITEQSESGRPNEILDKLRSNVIRSLHQSNGNSNIKDGMEVALCRFNPETRVLQFSGAFRPLFMVRENTVHHIAGDNMPIGIYGDNDDQSFSSVNIQLKKDDIVYMFTDGYVDQIGGPERKTFKTQRLKQLLLEISGLPMFEQKKLLERKIEEWQGELDQIDDILVMGFRIIN